MVIKSCPLLMKDTETCVGSSLASYFVLFSLISFCFRSFRFISFSFRWFRFVSFRFVFVDFVSFRFVFVDFVSFRFVSFLFRFALYRYVSIICMFILKWQPLFHTCNKHAYSVTVCTKIEMRQITNKYDINTQHRMKTKKDEKKPQK